MVNTQVLWKYCFILVVSTSFVAGCHDSGPCLMDALEDLKECNKAFLAKLLDSIPVPKIFNNGLWRKSGLLPTLPSARLPPSPPEPIVLPALPANPATPLLCPTTVLASPPAPEPFIYAQPQYVTPALTAPPPPPPSVVIAKPPIHAPLPCPSEIPLCYFADPQISAPKVLRSPTPPPVSVLNSLPVPPQAPLVFTAPQPTASPVVLAPPPPPPKITYPAPQFHHAAFAPTCQASAHHSAHVCPSTASQYPSPYQCFNLLPPSPIEIAPFVPSGPTCDYRNSPLLFKD